MIKAVVYDMDGLFVDSESLQTIAWDKFLKRYDHNIADVPMEVRNGFTGIRVIDGMIQINKILKLGDNLGELYNEREKIWIEIVKEELELMPGAIESLDFFRSKGMKIAIASSGSDEYIKAILDKFSLSDYFDVVVTGDCVKNGKPDPEPYTVACKKLDLEPEVCLVLEDAEKGVASAKENLSRADVELNSLCEINQEVFDSIN